jgi:starch synthase
MKIAIQNSDAIILGDEDLPENLVKCIEAQDVPILPYVAKEEFSNVYQNFYLKDVLNEEVE